jgi:hypothetical protein
MGIDCVIFVFEMEYTYNKAKTIVSATFETRLVLALE